MTRSILICAGCDVARPADELLSFSCPHLGQDGADHVLRMQLSSEAIAEGWPTDPLQPNDNAFVRYRKLSHTWHMATAAGMPDAEYVGIAEDLAHKLDAMGEALAITPLLGSEKLGCSIKNETINVSGSHKARHLIGTALHLLVAERLGSATKDTPLAIASCGNAALAAAVVAKAIHRTLRVFIPPNASTADVAKLESLGVENVLCERRESDPPGDPCYLRFAAAVRAGALPFSCQGSDNALALVGGHTLGWELIEQSSSNPASDIFVQVGGGALASSLMQAYSMANDANVISTLPRFHAVQTDNAHPLVRAWRTLKQSGETLQEARSHRADFMWPWESEPLSIAGGILDDETYDWFSIVSGLQASDGSAITVSEDRLTEAQELATLATGIAVDATGTAGLAGLLQARDDASIAASAHTLVLFTGAIR